MSVLRPPDVQQLQAPRQQSPVAAPVPPPSSTTGLQLALVGGGVLVILVIGLLALFSRGGAPPPPGEAASASLPSPVSAIATGPTIAPTPVCPGQQQLVLIEDLEQRGDWHQAARIADAALNLPGLCETDRQLLAQKAVASGLKALMVAPHRKTDRAQHQALVDQYLALQVRAHDAGVPFPPALQVAEEAHGRSQFLLAKAAIEQARVAGDFRPDIHRDVLSMYVSSLYGLCHWYTTAERGSETYNQGLAYCVASDRLADAFCTGQGEAATRLNELIGNARSRWPAPAETPLDSYAHEGCA
ncbi:MAG TPA: hypothetical protein VLA19_06770 [Herpetosiphonaceae bacterium]|nr:hypothetical protein [Herpetosiphonaceae bacterium]